MVGKNSGNFWILLGNSIGLSLVTLEEARRIKISRTTKESRIRLQLPITNDSPNEGKHQTPESRTR